jgi:spore germination protein GerM
VNRGRTALIASLVACAALFVWVLLVGVPRWYGHTVPATATPAAATTEAIPAGRKIKARLFYVAEEGTRLSSVEREVPYAAQPVDQAREILNAQIAPAMPPLISAIPAGTALRALFITSEGDAFVDMSRDIAAAHPGGSMNELLTIYTIVQVLTANLPAVTAVQLLVDGKEVDTLAGHVDLRHPLGQNTHMSGEN